MGLGAPNRPPLGVEAAAGAGAAAVLFPKRPPAEVVAVVAPDDADVVAPAAPKRPPGVLAGAVEAGVVDLFPKSGVAEPAVAVAPACAAGVLCGVELAAFPPKSPPVVEADVVAGCFAPKRPPEELGCAPPKSPAPDEAVVAGCEEGVELEVVLGFAAPPKRAGPELWPVVLGKRLEPPVLVLSVGGAPAGVVEAPRENNGFAGVAAGAAEGVLAWP